MNQGKYIFGQLTNFLPRRVFDRIVENHQGNKYVRAFYMLEPNALHGFRTTHFQRQYAGFNVEP